MNFDVVINELFPNDQFEVTVEKHDERRSNSNITVRSRPNNRHLFTTHYNAAAIESHYC